MAKRLLLLLAAGALLAAAVGSAGPAAAASKTVKITHTGYVPTTVSITASDTVVYMNSDTVAHTVSFKTTTGIKCSSTIPLSVPAGGSASCTFSSAGNFKFTDPANKGKSFQGTVTVAKAPPLSLTAAKTLAVYGNKVTLSGKLTSQQSGQSVQILAKQCGAAKSSVVATLTTTTGGAFSYAATPLMQTVYTAALKNATSTATTVQVAPRLRLGKVGRHRYSVRVFAAQSFAGKHATFQRYSRKLKHWRGVKGVLLQASSTGVAPTVISAATFRSSIHTGLRVRVVLKQTQVGACYAAGHSNSIRS